MTEGEGLTAARLGDRSPALRAQGDDLVKSLLSRLDELRQKLADERLGHFLCAEALRELRTFCGSGFITTELEERIDIALNQPRGLSAVEGSTKPEDVTPSPCSPLADIPK